MPSLKNRTKNRTIKNRFPFLVFSAVRKIPRGRVATYAAVAAAAGRRRAYRAVGNALNKNPFKSVPCHRVIRSDRTAGGFAPLEVRERKNSSSLRNRARPLTEFAGGTKEKTRLLEKEGVKFTRGRIDSSCVIPELPKSIL